MSVEGARDFRSAALHENHGQRRGHGADPGGGCRSARWSGAGWKGVLFEGGVRVRCGGAPLSRLGGLGTCLMVGERCGAFGCAGLCRSGATRCERCSPPGTAPVG